MTDRTPIDTIARRQRRDIHRLYRAFASAITHASVSEQGDRSAPITPAQASRLMSAVDDALDAIWGAERGDGGEVGRIIRRDTAAARLVPLQDAVDAYRRAMPAALRDAIETEARP